MDWETDVVEDIVADAQTQTEAQVSELFSKFLKARRKKISWPQFQRFVLNYLLAAEAAFLNAKKAIQQSTKTESPMLKDLLAEHKNRMTLIRRLGDAMAWEVTHYYRDYIDTFRNNSAPGLITGKTGSLVEQMIADLLSNKESDTFVLLHDITNCLRVGDLTVIRRGEKTLVIEVKSSERGTRRGRIQRQRERMERFAAYLTSNVGEIDPAIGKQFLIPIRAKDSYNWKLIEEVGQGALVSDPVIRDEQGTVIYVGFGKTSQPTSLPEHLAKIIWQLYKTERPVCTAASLHRNAYYAFRLIPLFCWSIDPRVILDIVFQRVAVVTIVDLAALEADARSHGISVFGPYRKNFDISRSRTVHRLLLEGWSLKSFHEQSATGVRTAKKTIRSYFRQERRLKRSGNV